LLKAHQRLLGIMQECGLKPSPPVRDDYFVYDWPETGR
jgi:hypothetical protein